MADEYYFHYGKSNSTKIVADNGDILRVASEEVLKTDNKGYPYYRGYISIPLELVQEKHISDTLDVLEKLSQFQPKRIPISEITRIEESVHKPETQQEEVYGKKKKRKKRKKRPVLDGPGSEVLRGWSSSWGDELDTKIKELSYKYPITIADIMRLAEIARAEIVEWVSKKRIPKKIYNELAEEGKPLPRRLYVDQRKGKFWAQLHIRGVEPELYESVKSKKIPLWKALIGQSYHTDIRCDFEGLSKLVQVVVTEENVQDMIKTFKGERRETAGGINVSHSMVVSKPSGEPPREEERRLSKSTKISPALDEEGAKLAESLDLKSSSYWIEPGGIGSTKNTYAYMMHICSGTIIEGAIRDDLKEWFLTKEEANGNILNGKFTIKALQSGDTPNRFEIWKSISKPIPLDPIMHSCTNAHWLIPAKSLTKFGREAYREESQKLFKSKLE